MKRAIKQASTTDPARGLLTILLVTAFPVMTAFLLGPFGIFGGNREEFEAGFLDLLPTLLLAAGLCWLVLALIGLALRGGIRERYLWLVLALGALMWIQSTFLMHDYGVLDGRGMDWAAAGGFAWLDIVLWLGVPLALVALAPRLQALLVPAAVAIIVVQLVGAIESASSLDEPVWRSQVDAQEEPPDALFEHSTGPNILHVVLDNFQSDVFAELVTEEGLESAFDGFVQFTENAAAAPYTSLAIPSIQLGRSFDGSVSNSDFRKEAAEKGILSRLHELGYRVNLSLMRSLGGTQHDATYYVPSTDWESPAGAARSEALKLLDVMFFRLAPHLARDWVYNDNNWHIRRLLDDPEALPKAFVHRKYMRHYANRIVAAGDKPAYHYMHVLPPHPPYVTNADGTPAGQALPNTRENYRHEARATLHATVSILEALKARGLYDNSLIILQSDHGGAFEPEFTPTRMLTLLAVKRRGSHGALTQSRAQTSVTDVAATIIDEEGLDIAWPGDSIFSIPENAQRTRYYTMYYGDTYDALRRVRISGPLGSPASYEYLDPQNMVVHRPVYNYGSVVNVGLEGEATGYLGEGWSSPSPRLVWNDGHEAALIIPVEPSGKELDLSLWLLPSIHGDSWPRQRIILDMQDQEIARWELTERESVELKASIPAELTDTDELVLHFQFPDAVRQPDIGVGQDRRLQAIALGRFRLTETSEATNDE